MSFELINKVNQAQKKQAVVDVRSGDTVRVYQKIKEGNKERIQMFEGVVIRTDNKQSHTRYSRYYISSSKSSRFLQGTHTSPYSRTHRRLRH